MKFIQVIFFFLFSLFNVAVLAEQPTKVVLHVNDSYKLKHLESSVINIREELGDKVVIKVVVNGRAVTNFVRTDVRNTSIVKSVLGLNASIGLCHNAVRNNKVDKSMMIEGVELLKTDGNVTVIKYQKQGFLYIKM